MTSLVRHFIPAGLPAEWALIDEDSNGVMLRSRTKGLAVIYSLDTERDGRRWLHLSVSRASRIPSWEDLRLVKDTFIGEDRAAYQVLPRSEEYVNIAPYVLHLWSCLDGPDPLPDFRRDFGGMAVI